MITSLLYWQMHMFNPNKTVLLVETDLISSEEGYSYDHTT